MSAGKPTVLVTEPLNESSLEYLKEHSNLVRVPRERIDEAIADADGLIVRTYTQVNKELLAKAPGLKVVGRAGVALDNIDLPACVACGVQVVHTPQANTLAVVDYTIRMIIEMNRRFWPMKGWMSGEDFHAVRKQTFGRFLGEATLGIIGCGRIGGRVGRAAAGLGMCVLYNDILDIRVDYPAEAVDKDTLYAASDIVTIHVPLDDTTRGFINTDALAKFKNGAQFINAARGPCVDYHALATALRSGKLSAAVIDCHHPEPPPKDYPLFGLDNVILTPHIAARVPQATQNMSDVVFDVIAVLQGRTPKFPA